MSANDWGKLLNDLREDLTLIKNKAQMVSLRFEGLRKEAESLKITVLPHQLEEQRKSLAWRRGFTSIARDEKRLRTSFGVATVASILAGIMTKDKLIALNAGLSGFDGVVEGLGETSWAVSLERNLAIAPRANITPEGVWVTWESLKAALAELEREASGGDQLGSLDNIITRLQKSRELVRLNVSVAKPITVWTKVKSNQSDSS